MSIMLVEDAPGQRLLLAMMLKRAGYEELLQVATTEEAIDLLVGSAVAPAQDVDLILLGIDPPDTDGLGLCRQVKADEKLRSIPVIIVTDKRDLTSLDAAFEAGVMDFISKPPDPVELRARVHAALRLKRETDQRVAREQQLRQLTAKLEEANRRLEAANEQLERLSSLDGLTGIPNRRRFDQALLAEWRRAARHCTWVSLVMIDIDYFKAYNDTYGHQAGDETLRQVASALVKGLSRAGEIVARYGGEEFAAILPGVSPSEALAVAERLRRRVADLQIPHSHSPAGKCVTISLGVAGTIPQADEHPAATLELADRALYRAKQAGRDLVVIAEH